MISWLRWRGVSFRPGDSSDIFRKFQANSSSIARRVPFAKSKCINQALYRSGIPNCTFMGHDAYYEKL